MRAARCGDRHPRTRHPATNVEELDMTVQWQLWPSGISRWNMEFGCTTVRVRYAGRTERRSVKVCRSDMATVSFSNNRNSRLGIKKIL